MTRAAPAAILPAMQTVNLSAASAAMRAGASAGSGATMIALLLLVNLALAGAVSLPPLPSGARSAGAGLALDAVLLALLVAGPVAPDPQAEICGDPSVGATPAEQAEATREACASAEEARS